MSADNQILIKEHKNKWLVFDNIMAESWCERNCLKASTGKKFNTEKEARNYAYKLSKLSWNEVEYGISNHLVKDGADVDIID